MSGRKFVILNWDYIVLYKEKIHEKRLLVWPTEMMMMTMIMINRSEHLQLPSSFLRVLYVYSHLILTLWGILLPFYRCWNWSSRRLSAWCDGTCFSNGGARIWRQTVLLQSLGVSPPSPLPPFSPIFSLKHLDYVNSRP